MADVKALRFLFLLCAVVLGGCSTPQLLHKSSLQVNGLEFENRSRTHVDGIRLLVPATDNFVSCGRIAPGATCATGFPGVEYSGNPVVVEWNQGGAPWSTGEITVQIDEAVQQAGFGEVRVIILSPGSAGVLMVESKELIGGFSDP